MSKILAVKHVDVKSKTDGGVKRSILVTTARGLVWVTPGQWKASGASNALGNYIGGNIDAEYFMQGELLFDGITECTKDETILKSVYLAENPEVLARSLVIESNAKMEEAFDMQAMLAQKREALKAALAAKKAVVEATPLA